jgi:hypothetical protein
MQIKKLVLFDFIPELQCGCKPDYTCRMEESQNGYYVLYTDALKRENALIEALRNALTAIDAFWPDDPPENEQEASEDQAIAGIRKTSRKLIREMEETRQ